MLIFCILGKTGLDSRFLIFKIFRIKIKFDLITTFRTGTGLYYCKISVTKQHYTIFKVAVVF